MNYPILAIFSRNIKEEVNGVTILKHHKENVSYSLLLAPSINFLFIFHSIFLSPFSYPSITFLFIIFFLLFYLNFATYVIRDL